ncbi:MAG: hypothetical protein N3B21_14555 [Clostridia bacterium]|nr:hypothetical protein [Clostridia bacterium]
MGMGYEALGQNGVIYTKEYIKSLVLLSENSNISLNMNISCEILNFSKKGSNPFYNNIRKYINIKKLNEAEVMLNSVEDRPAEWHYLKGIINLQRGWYDIAQENLQQAVKMQPDNTEFIDALANMLHNNSLYLSFSYNSDRKKDKWYHEVCSCCDCNTDCCDCCHCCNKCENRGDSHCCCGSECDCNCCD